MTNLPSPALCLLIATALPAIAAILTTIWGRRFGLPLAAWVAAALTIAAFAFTLVAMVKWYEGKHGLATWGMGTRPIVRTIRWLPADHFRAQASAGSIDVGIYVDSTSLSMVSVVALIGAIVQIYSASAHWRLSDYTPLVACLAFQCFSSMALFLSGTLAQIVACWILLGVSGVLLTALIPGRTGSAAGGRTAIVWIVGDVMMLIGFGLLFSRLGNSRLPELWAFLGRAASGHRVVLPDGAVISAPMMSCIGLCLFGGAAARAALFPLQIWLNAMADAPSAALALIFGPTTFASAIYLVARIYPMLTPDARLFIGIVGLVTMGMCALVAFGQSDLPRLLAWTAAAQAGLMILGIGVGSWIGALFVVLTQAFSQALIFLAAGAVMSIARRRELAGPGMLRRMPMTAILFAIAALSVCGVPGFSGYWSQKMLLGDAASYMLLARGLGRTAAFSLLFWGPVILGGIISLTLCRCWFTLFLGTADHEPGQAPLREYSSQWWPMAALAIPTLIAGYAMNIPELLQASVDETRAISTETLARIAPGSAAHFTAMQEAWPSVAPPVIDTEPSDVAEPVAAPVSTIETTHERGRALARQWLTYSRIAGVAMSALFYWQRRRIAWLFANLALARWTRDWLADGMFFDELYDWTIVNLVIGLARTCSAIDVYVLDAFPRWVARRAIRVSR